MNVWTNMVDGQPENMTSLTLSEGEGTRNWKPQQWRCDSKHCKGHNLCNCSNQLLVTVYLSLTIFHLCIFWV